MRCFQNRKLSGRAMECLAEISAITTLDDNTTPLPDPAKQLLAKLFTNVMQLLTKMVPTASVIRLATDGCVENFCTGPATAFYFGDGCSSGCCAFALLAIYSYHVSAFVCPSVPPAVRPDEGQEFIHALCVFLTQFFSNHLPVVLSSMPVVNAAMRYLVEITKANDKDLFSMCMDFWHEFTKSLYNKVMSRPAVKDLPAHLRVKVRRISHCFEPTGVIDSYPRVPKIYLNNCYICAGGARRGTVCASSTCSAMCCYFENGHA